MSFFLTWKATTSRDTYWHRRVFEIYHNISFREDLVTKLFLNESLYVLKSPQCPLQEGIVQESSVFKVTRKKYLYSLNPNPTTCTHLHGTIVPQIVPHTNSSQARHELTYRMPTFVLTATHSIRFPKTSSLGLPIHCTP
jgi:hypothetical protein